MKLLASEAYYFDHTVFLSFVQKRSISDFTDTVMKYIKIKCARTDEKQGGMQNSNMIHACNKMTQTRVK